MLDESRIEDFCTTFISMFENGAQRVTSSEFISVIKNMKSTSGEHAPVVALVDADVWLKIEAALGFTDSYVEQLMSKGNDLLVMFESDGVFRHDFLLTDNASMDDEAWETYGGDTVIQNDLHYLYQEERTDYIGYAVTDADMFIINTEGFI